MGDRHFNALVLSFPVFNMDPIAISQEDNNGATRETGISQSHTVVSQTKEQGLRLIKSPQSNLELHHTRSFSEICHLHPSITDLSLGVQYPKSKVIGALQQEHVRRPESVLELSAQVTDSEDEDGEDIYDAEVNGNEAMRRFLESNISVPLDGALTSSSGSLLSAPDSDVASESELVVANWEHEGRC